jgi:hypothetical protein
MSSVGSKTTWVVAVAVGAFQLVGDLAVGAAVESVVGGGVVESTTFPALGSGYLLVDDCDDDTQLCRDGACLDLACEASTVRCSGDTLLDCC